MKEKHKATSTVVAQINRVNILMVENGEKRIAIKPICEALGINYSTQLEKLKSDEILNTTISLRGTVGADGKPRDMLTMPYKYVFGWLFTINPKNVKEEARETVQRYRMECYEALFNHFTSQNKFLEEKQHLIEEKIDEVNLISKEFSDAKNKLKDAKNELDIVKGLTYDAWRANGSQQTLAFPQEQEGGQL